MNIKENRDSGAALSVVVNSDDKEKVEVNQNVGVRILDCTVTADLQLVNTGVFSQLLP